MTTLSHLEKKLEIIEDRLRKLERQLDETSNTPDQAWLDALYQQAKKLVLTNRKASVFFLQRKLLIDFKRAEEVLKKLEAQGVIGPADSSGHHQLL